MLVLIHACTIYFMAVKSVIITLESKMYHFHNNNNKKEGNL